MERQFKKEKKTEPHAIKGKKVNNEYFFIQILK